MNFPAITRMPEIRGQPMKVKTTEKRQKRIDAVNQLVKVIGSHGRKFFNYQGRFALIEIDARGRVWWSDQYSGKRIYTHYNGRWKGFTNGGTLKDLVIAFRDFVSNGKPVAAWHFGPWPQHLCDGDLWGYGEDMSAVRDAASRLGMISTQDELCEVRE